MEDEKNISDDDKVYCESIGKSIADIIRFSFDEEFRKKCFELLGVFSTKQTEKEINNRLVSLIEKENSNADKCKSSRFKEKEKENARVCNDFPEENQIEQACGKNSGDDVQNASKNPLSKKSWLEISSQQFRDAIKRKKLNCYSQPLFTESFEKKSDLSNSKLHFSNSQPTFECSHSVFNETKEYSCKLSNNEIKLNDKKFEESFNFQKYFK